MRRKITDKKAMYALEVLPPTCWYRTKDIEVFQTGEPYKHNPITGNPMFQTYKRSLTKDKSWYSLGISECIKLDKKYLIMANPEYYPY